jgi:putative chitinase
MMMDGMRAQQRLKDRGYQIAVDGAFGPKSYAALMAFVGNKKQVALHEQLGAAAAKHFPAHQVDTAKRIADFLAQSSVETMGFTRLVENLNYRAERIRQVWPSRFPSLASAQPFAHNPEALANKVYGGRYGNTKPGDGFKYRGRGTKQTTFADNYAEVQRVTGLPVLDNPDLLAAPDDGMLAGCIYWRERGCAALADAGDFEALTRRINGGVNGLADRKIARQRAALILL